MKNLFAGVLALALLTLSAPAVQGQIDLGPQLSVAEDVDVGIGVNVVAPLATLHENLEFSGNFTFYFPDGVDYWEVDGDVRYLFPIPDNTSILPFAMAGLAIGYYSWDAGIHDGSETELGLRLGGGFKVPMDNLTPFLELGLGVGDIPDFTLRGGLTFPLGG
ncbi:MAG: hypothetical protein ACQET1_02825 [Gemmatimonadota bacterium]